MTWPVFMKSLREQIRNYWILILTVSLAPFFVFVYYLINEASQPSYHVLVLNEDTGISVENAHVNLGKGFLSYMDETLDADDAIPLIVREVNSRERAEKKLKQGNVEMLLVLPPDLSRIVIEDDNQLPDVEIMGDLTNTYYLLAAVLVGDYLNHYLSLTTGKEMLYTITETPLGGSGNMSEFDLWMPGIMILAIIMLMFSATIAIITEVDQKTIMRLQLSKIRTWQILSGVGAVQVLVGLVSILLTLLMAIMLGFNMQGSFLAFLLVAVLTSISMIAFSLLLAAFTRSATEVLIIGNFPLFLFMFFTGAAFPIRPDSWFTVGGYGINWQSLMSPTHAVKALNKISIMGQTIPEVIPELAALTVMTIVYTLFGLWAFNRRHLKQHH